MGKPVLSTTPLTQAWRKQDVRAGLLFLVIGLTSAFEGGLLDQGTASRMGPGYLPLRLGLALSVLGLAIAWIGALRGVAQPQGSSPVAFGPILAATAGLVLFGLVIEPAGLVAASVLLVVTSRLVQRRGHAREIVWLALLLSAVVVLVFRYGLGLPVGLWPAFLIA